MVVKQVAASGESVRKSVMGEFRSVLHRILMSAVMAVCIFGVTNAKAADDPSYLRVGTGYYDINDNMDAAEFHVEYIHGRKLWVFNPFFGVMTTSDKALYGYAGIRLDLFLNDNWVLTPQFSPGLYHDGDGKDLGHTIEFRSGLELAYRFEDRSRLGMTIYHISNAHLSSNNPGTEVLTVHYSYPFNKLFGGE